MKILIEIPYGCQLFVEEPRNVAGLMESIAGAKLVKSSGYGKDREFTAADDSKIDIEILPDNYLIKPSDIVTTLKAEKETADKRWIEYYNKSNAFEAELKNLRSDLDSRGIPYTKPEAK